MTNRHNYLSLLLTLALLSGVTYGQDGWTKSGSNVYLTTSTDKVGVGWSSPAQKLELRTVGEDVAIYFHDQGIQHYVIGIDHADGQKFKIARGSDFSEPKMTIIPASGNVGIGTAAPQSKLAVNGTITAKEVEVTLTGWPDFVFAPGYRRRPLNEVAAYIQAHGHLPEVPSEQEVATNGVALGQMQATLLQKVEELTLYMIELKNENAALKARVGELER